MGKFCSWVIVIGDNRHYLTALITIRNKNEPSLLPVDEIEESSRKELIKKGIIVEKISELFLKENYLKLEKIIKHAIDNANEKSISRAAKIKKWMILKRDLSIPTDEITPTMKLKRKKVEQNF